MSWLSRLRNVFRSDLTDDIDREVGFHLASREDDLVRSGLSTDVARHEARRRFGNPGVHRENTRDRDIVRWLDTLIADTRYAIRGLRNAPGFALVSILSLALGIGANTAIFTAVNAVMLRPLPVRNADELAYITTDRDETFSYPMYEHLRDQVRSFHSFAAVERGTAQHELSAESGGGQVELVRGPAVSGSFFSALGASAALGRVLGPDDDRRDSPPALVISHALWQRRFGGDSSAVGRTVRLDSMPVTIVGVMPAGFVGFDAGAAADLWWPINLAPRLSSDANWESRLTSGGVTWLLLFGRLGTDVSRERAAADVAIVFRTRLTEEANNTTQSPADRGRMLSEAVTLHSGAAGYVRARSMFRQPLCVLMTVVALSLLVACANVAGLLLARGAARQHEFALRAALGGGRGRIVRQLLTESLLLSLAGGVAGLLIAYWATRMLGAYLPADEMTLSLAPDGRVLLFTAALSLVTGVLFGLAPALRLSRVDLATAIKQRGGGSPSRSHRLLQPTLVTLQITLSMLLLASAGLFGRTLDNLRRLELGFEQDNLIGFSIDAGRRRPNGRERNDIEHRLLSSLEALPGVRSATITGAGLLSGNGYSTEVRVDGHVLGPDEEPKTNVVLAGPRFFETMKVPLLRGREFSARDEPVARPEGPPAKSTVVILGEALAQRYFVLDDPIGREISVKDGVRLTIIGVAGDTKYADDLRKDTPLQIYLPYFGSGVRMPSTLYLRAQVPLASLASSIHRAVTEIDTRVTARRVTTMNATVDRLLVRERLIAQLAGFFSVFTMLLACLGLYGLVSYDVTRRTREFGVRIALGASARQVFAVVLRQGLTLAVVGCAVGFVVAIGLTRLIASMLYGVGPADPVTLLVVMAVLLAVSLLACWLPAQRASRADALVALRAE